MLFYDGVESAAKLGKHRGFFQGHGQLFDFNDPYKGYRANTEFRDDFNQMKNDPDSDWNNRHTGCPGLMQPYHVSLTTS